MHISELLQKNTLTERDKLKYFKKEILKEIQKTEPKVTATWVHWRIVKGVYPCDADAVEQLFYRTQSKARNDRISFKFAFNCLTKCSAKNVTKK